MLVRVGRLLKSHGVHGQAKCAYTTDDPQNIPSRSSYLLVDPLTGEIRPACLVASKLQTDYFLARFDLFDSPEAVQQCGGWDIMYVTGKVNRELGEIYFYDLPGLEVRTPAGRILGTVDNIIDSGAHVLLEIDNLQGQLLPFTDMFISEVNLDQGYLVCSYPVEDPRSSK